MTGLIGLAYIVIGVVVAAANGYFQNLRQLKAILSLILAILLWPLVLLGVDLRIGDLEAILDLF